MKKLLSLVVALVAVVAFAKPVKAEAAAISANEQQIVSALKQPVTIGGQSFTLPQEYLTQTENYLKANDLTAAQVNTVLSDIKGVMNILANANVDASKIDANDITSLGRLLSAADVAAIKNLVTNAASTIGLTVTNWGHGAVEFADKSGETVLTTGSAVKQTGANYMVSLIVLVSLLAGAAGAFAVSRKTRLA